MSPHPARFADYWVEDETGTREVFRSYGLSYYRPRAAYLRPRIVAIYVLYSECLFVFCPSWNGSCRERLIDGLHCKCPYAARRWHNRAPIIAVFQCSPFNRRDKRQRGWKLSGGRLLVFALAACRRLKASEISRHPRNGNSSSGWILFHGHRILTAASRYRWGLMAPESFRVSTRCKSLSCLWLTGHAP
jgi:hypothetical protein